MENALQIISGAIPDNKEEISTFVKSFVDAAKNGYNQPLLVLKKLKILEEITKKIKEELKCIFVDESDLFNEKTFDAFGCTFQKREVPRYDFSNCGDSLLNLAYTELKQKEEYIKSRENYLKTIKGPTPIVETGEIVYPPTKIVNSSIAVILK